VRNVQARRSGAIDECMAGKAVYKS